MELLFYYRYVDDILVCLPALNMQFILDKFNKVNHNLQFTLEESLENNINFLDLSIAVCSGELITDIYRKPTFWRRFLNFHLFCPTKYKIPVIASLIDRIRLLSHSNFHIKNIRLMRELLKCNSHPLFFVDKIIESRFL